LDERVAEAQRRERSDDRRNVVELSEFGLETCPLGKVLGRDEVGGLGVTALGGREQHDHCLATELLWYSTLSMATCDDGLK